MVSSFRTPSLPLIIATSIGKNNGHTQWILDEFCRLVRTELNASKIWIGSAGAPFREINAAADLGMLLKARDVVLTNQSTFSFYVQSKLQEKGDSKVAYVDPGGCGLGRPSWVWV